MDAGVLLLFYTRVVLAGQVGRTRVSDHSVFCVKANPFLVKPLTDTRGYNGQDQLGGWTPGICSTMSKDLRYWKREERMYMAIKQQINIQQTI